MLHLVLDFLFLWIVTLSLVFLVLDDRAILGSAAQGFGETFSNPGLPDVFSWLAQG